MIDFLGKTFYSFNFLSYLTVLIILFLNNSEAQWNQQNSGTNYDLNGVSFYDSLYGWVVGKNGIILHTTDGENNWFLQSSTIRGSIRGVSFCDTMNGWAAGDEGIVLVTSNGGENWKGIVTNNFNSSKDLIMLGDTGYVVQLAGKIFQTTDGGYTWNQQSSGENSINDIDFV
ncbi:MAG: YCF48-related protein, partial [Ignavibacteriaceae bacterium]